VTTHKRPERVGQLIQQRLGEIFATGNLKDPRLGLITITGARCSPDLRQARVYWTVHGDAVVRKDTQKGLEAARGFLRRELGTLGLRVVPELSFSYDEAIDRGDRIDQLLREAKAADQRRLSDVAEASEPSEASTLAEGSKSAEAAPAVPGPSKGGGEAA
jgi:ribosome-binding factor A